MKKDLKRLIAIGGITAVTDIFMNTFVTARIFTMTQNSIQSIAYYYILQYLCIAATFLVAGTFIKARPIGALRLGIILNAILLIALKDDTVITQQYLLVGMVFGVAQGAYYAPFSVLVGWYNNNNTVWYCTLSNMVYNIVAVVIPITIGAYITVSSFARAIIGMTILSIMQLVISLGLTKMEPQTGKCDVIKFVQYISKNTCGKKIWNYYRIGFFKGITSSVLDRTVLMMIMLLFGSTFELGALGTVFAICTIITAWCVKQWYRPEKGKALIVVSAIMPMLAVVGLLCFTGKATFIAYKAISAVFLCILSLLSDMDRYDSLDESLKQFTTEHQAMSELTLASGRIAGLVILLILNNWLGGLTAMKAMLVFIGASILAYAYYIAKQRIK